MTDPTDLTAEIFEILDDYLCEVGLISHIKKSTAAMDQKLQARILALIEREKKAAVEEAFRLPKAQFHFDEFLHDERAVMQKMFPND